MAKFKVGDRVRRINSSNGDGMDVGTEWIVAGFKKFYRDDYLVFEGGRDGNAVNFEPVAVAPATATLTIEAGKYYKTRDGRKVGPLVDYPGSMDNRHPFECEGFIWQVDGTNYDGADSPHTLIAEWVDEPATPAQPAPTPLHVTLGIDLNPSLAPQVGDSVLIKGTLAGITTSPRGTNYNIVFETQNRRMSLHFLEEDFIVAPSAPDCPCATNDNGPPPFGGDRAKAFDALGSWLNSLAVNRAA